MSKKNEYEKLVEKGKFSFGNVVGHAGSLVSTGMGIKSGMNEDKRYAQELAARGIKDDRSWVSRNAKALTSGVGGAVGGALSSYITRKTGLAQNKTWLGKALNVGVGYAASNVGNKLANMPLKKYRESVLKKHDQMYGEPESSMQSFYYPGGEVRFYSGSSSDEVRKPAHDENKPNWIQRNKKLLIGAGITAGLAAGGYYLGKHIGNKVNQSGGSLKNHLDTKSVEKYLNSKGIHKWNKGMDSSVYKSIVANNKKFLSNPQFNGYLDNRVKERFAGYGLAAAGALGAAGSLALMKKDKDPETKIQSRAVNWGIKGLNSGGYKRSALGTLSGFIADRLLPPSNDEEKSKMLLKCTQFLTDVSKVASSDVQRDLARYVNSLKDLIKSIPDENHKLDLNIRANVEDLSDKIDSLKNSSPKLEKIVDNFNHDLGYFMGYISQLNK